MNIEDTFKGSPTTQSIKSAIDKIDQQIHTIRNIAMDPRASLKTKKIVEDLKWEREKLVQKLQG